MKKLLFIGGSVESPPAIQHALYLGYGAVVTDGNVRSAGMEFARENELERARASTYSAEETLRAVRRKGWVIDGVVSVGCDVGPVVSAVAAEPGLKHIPVGIAQLGWNKVELKRVLSRRGIPVPRTGFVKSSRWGVRKPIYQGRGARNVQRIKMQAIPDLDPDDNFFVEEWIPGHQVSTETIIWNGIPVFTGITDRDYGLLDDRTQYVIESGGWGPSKFEGTRSGDRIRLLISRIIATLGLQSGTIKGDIVLNDRNYNEPTVIEVSIGRLSGGYSCSHYIPKAYGTDFLGAAYAVACGDPPGDYLFDPDVTPVHVRGVYSTPDTATNHSERGDFFLAEGETRGKAELKAQEWLDEQQV